jgi:hypothetical protein
VDDPAAHTRAGALAALALLVALAAWGCGTPPPPRPAAPRTAEPAPATPADGLARIALPRRDEATYRVVAMLEGEEDVQPVSAAPTGYWHRKRTVVEVELVYHGLAPAHPPPDEIGTALVLDALRHRILIQEPRAKPLRKELEIADDRMLAADGDEITTDLRGAQPREGLTPRMVLGRSFAFLRQDLEGRVISISPQGLPPAKRLLRPLELRPVIELSRLPRPTTPVGPGASWSGGVFPLSPAGRLGLWLDATWELSGFQNLDGRPCAWIVLRGGREGSDVMGETGIPFERVDAEIHGEAWVDLATARVRRYVLEEEVRAAYERRLARDRGTRHRARHQGRLVLELLDPAPEPDAPWADGTERFRRR